MWNLPFSPLTSKIKPDEIYVGASGKHIYSTIFAKSKTMSQERHLVHSLSSYDIHQDELEPNLKNATYRHFVQYPVLIYTVFSRK